MKYFYFFLSLLPCFAVFGLLFLNDFVEKLERTNLFDSESWENLGKAWRI